ncbi:hypothetical protein BKN38_05825 [Helicobacter sp. CLO-3]|nr:hypothetical protein BA723_07205 [Helicobacter sp. CLO-3]OHU83094.1 hypothetical protein BKN38_05825 [Helicobacter sp. CLO-3]
MRVVHVTSLDSGGAANSCTRVHRSLLQYGVDSIVLTMSKTSSIAGVERLARTRPQKLMEKLRAPLSQLPLMFYPKRHKDIFSPNIPFFTPHNRTLLKRLKELKPDIVHLHWIENGFLNIKDLESIDAPMLWSLHDMNPYTGGCHYVEPSCNGFLEYCRNCPALDSNRKYDLSFWTFFRKRRTYGRLKKLTIHGPSKWMAEDAKKSSLLKNKPIISFPTPVDTKIYAPMSKVIAREILTITPNKKIIAFGATDIGIARKGFAELESALKMLPDDLKSQCEIVVFGANQLGATSEAPQIAGINAHFLGRLGDDISLRIAYNAADIFVTPSLAENLSNAIMESLSCGTPVVAFDIGGNGDMISHKQNGYLAKERDIADLAKGLEWILRLDASEYEALSQRARQSAESKFSMGVVAKQYIEAYSKILSKSS